MLVFLTKCSVYFGRFWPVIKSTLSRNIWHHGSLWALAEQYDWKWVFHFGTVRPLSFLLRALKQGQHFENIIIFINFLLLYTNSSQASSHKVLHHFVEGPAENQIYFGMLPPFLHQICKLLSSSLRHYPLPFKNKILPWLHKDVLVCNPEIAISQLRIRKIIIKINFWLAASWFNCNVVKSKFGRQVIVVLSSVLTVVVDLSRVAKFGLIVKSYHNDLSTHDYQIERT